MVYRVSTSHGVVHRVSTSHGVVYGVSTSHGVVYVVSTSHGPLNTGRVSSCIWREEKYIEGDICSSIVVILPHLMAGFTTHQTTLNRDVLGPPCNTAPELRRVKYDSSRT